MAEENFKIVTKNISKTYRSDGTKTCALNNVSLEIEPGEFVMITGRNGSGKSTLLHQLGLLDFPDSGKIFIFGQEVTHLSEKERMKMRLKQLGYIFQEFALVSELSALENAMLPAMMVKSSKEARKRALNLLEKVGLKDKLEHLPSQLSGGEQQKVAIARALANNPKIIFADEPTANLDTAASKDVLEIFRELNQERNITIVMITHEPEEFIYATRRIKLSDGEVI